jgi:predicted dehydrogenase
VRWCRRQAYYDADSWRGTWALDGGVLANQASHHVDLLQWMMGDVESVHAVGRTALAKIETEDVAAAVVTFRSGAIGIIEATTCARPTDLEGSLSVLGSEGTVEIGGFAVNELKVWRFEQQTTEDESVIASYSVNPPDVYGFGHATYYVDVVGALKTGRKALVEGIEGRKSLELLAALYESMASGKTTVCPVDATSHTKLGLQG